MAGTSKSTSRIFCVVLCELHSWSPFSKWIDPSEPLIVMFTSTTCYSLWRQESKQFVNDAVAMPKFKELCAWSHCIDSPCNFTKSDKLYGDCNDSKRVQMFQILESKELGCKDAFDCENVTSLEHMFDEEPAHKKIFLGLVRMSLLWNDSLPHGFLSSNLLMCMHPWSV